MDDKKAFEDAVAMVGILRVYRMYVAGSASPLSEAVERTP